MGDRLQIRYRLPDPGWELSKVAQLGPMRVTGPGDAASVMLFKLSGKN